jgi:hypothetical protein
VKLFASMCKDATRLKSMAIEAARRTDRDILTNRLKFVNANMQKTDNGLVVKFLKYTV